MWRLIPCGLLILMVGCQETTQTPTQQRLRKPAGAVARGRTQVVALKPAPGSDYWTSAAAIKRALAQLPAEDAAPLRERLAERRLPKLSADLAYLLRPGHAYYGLTPKNETLWQADTTSAERLLREPPFPDGVSRGLRRGEPLRSAELIIGYDPRQPPPTVQRLQDAERGKEMAERWRRRKPDRPMDAEDFIVWRQLEGFTFDDIRPLLLHPGVKYIESNAFGKVLISGQPPNGDQHNRAFEYIDAAAAWANLPAARVPVAIVDTGLSYNEKCFAGCIHFNTADPPGTLGGDPAVSHDDDWNGWADDHVGASVVCAPHKGDCVNQPTDFHGHGSKCASVVQTAADWPRHGLVPPTAPCLVPVRVFEESDDTGVVLRGDTDAIAEHVAEGISYAARRQCPVILLTCGFGAPKACLETAIIQARSRGLLVVCAAGAGVDNADVHTIHPAASGLENLLTVTSVDDAGHLATSAPQGRHTVHLAAPGVSIPCLDRDGKEVFASGTSMAAALTAGAAALVWSHPAYHQAHYCQIKDALCADDHTQPVAGPWDPDQFNGRALDLTFLGPDKVLEYRGKLVADAQGRPRLVIGALQVPLDFAGQDDLLAEADALQDQEVLIKARLRHDGGATPDTGWTLYPTAIDKNPPPVQSCTGVLPFMSFN